MKVFKFGGASVSSIERIGNVKNIISQHSGEQLVVIISAMGKTTNALEKVAEAFFAGNKQQALDLFNVVKQQHLNTTKYLLVTHYNACLAELLNFFTEVEWLLHDQPVHAFDYYYDQIVCTGELMSTCIVSFYLNESGVSNEWLDVRDLLRTDNNFRDANINWAYSGEKIPQAVQGKSLVITQGFIGSTDENESTTLGREGSDYTAAIFANLLNAESLTIWKDVEGVMNADPKAFPDAVLLHNLGYNEVIEMAFYGAQVIHPKTIKPLQNKNIPLLVKSFLDPSLPGTCISQKGEKTLPPVIVVKRDQVLMQLTSQDFSFVGEKPMGFLYEQFATLQLRPNLLQTGAINVQLVLDDKSDKLDQLALAAAEQFNVQVEKGLELLTIRHYTAGIVAELTAGRNIQLLQQTPVTIQVVYR
jgi:aspartate kinase